MLAREARRERVRVAEELARRGDQRAERVPRRDRLQPARQGLGRDERIRDEREREDDQEAELLPDLDRRHDQPDQHADPRHREREEEHQRDGEEELADRSVHAPADDEAGQHQHDEDARVVDHVRDRAAAEDGRARHRQRAEAVDQALAMSSVTAIAVVIEAKPSVWM